MGCEEICEADNRTSSFGKNTGGYLILSNLNGEYYEAKTYSIRISIGGINYRTKDLRSQGLMEKIYWTETFRIPVSDGGPTSLQEVRFERIENGRSSSTETITIQQLLEMSHAENEE